MTLSDAAKELKVHIGTLRRDVRNGCPTLSLGSVGRGHGTQIDPEAWKLWRAERAVPSLAQQTQDTTLSTLTTILVDTLKRDDLAACAQLSEGQAYMAVLKIYERAYRNVTQSPLTADQLPVELKPFHAIVLESIERGTFYSRR